MKNAVLFLFLLYGFSLHTQTTGTSDILPRGFAPGEEEMMQDYLNSRYARNMTCITDAPLANSVRSMAEWEELQAVVITWTNFADILTEIVRYAKEEVEVIIVCEDQIEVKNKLSAEGVDWSSNVVFLENEFNSIWVRDYGPNTVYLDDVETLAFVDWIYNRPRPLDDVVPETIAEYLGIDNYCTSAQPFDLVHTGGNFMSDGLGTAFSSNLVLDENGSQNSWGISNHSEADVDQIMHDFMGITAYPKMDNLPFDLIHHIDMHMKLLDEERLIVGQYPDGVADGPQIEANIQYILNNYNTAYGEPFEIIRVPMPPGENGNYPDDYPGNQWWLGGDYRTYANAIFLNNTILVPTYEEQYDTTGLRIWEEAMPGYNIVGIDCNDIIPLSGALHCITKEVGVAEPLWITHQKVKEACAGTMPVVTAQIKGNQGVSDAQVYYTTDQINWSVAEMILLGDHLYGAQLDDFSEGSTVHYYIKATSTADGKTITRPLPGADAAWSFQVEDCAVSSEDILGAEISFEPAFPNPASAITCIPVQSTYQVNGRIEVRDVLGSLVETVYQGDIPSGDSKYFIDAANYSAGAYFINLKTENQIYTQKLIVK